MNLRGNVYAIYESTTSYCCQLFLHLLVTPAVLEPFSGSAVRSAGRGASDHEDEQEQGRETM